jgi:hypothetical protein
LPHGVLFRGAAEGHIRQFMIEKLNCIDAVIGLPANIFYGTSIPTCVVLRKCRKHNDSILFIDASNDFEKVKTQNRLLPEHIDKLPIPITTGKRSRSTAISRRWKRSVTTITTSISRAMSILLKRKKRLTSTLWRRKFAIWKGKWQRLIRPLLGSAKN